MGSFQHHLEPKYFHHVNAQWTNNFLLTKMWIKHVTSYKVTSGLFANSSLLHNWVFTYFLPILQVQSILLLIRKEIPSSSFSEWLLFWWIFFNEPNLCEGCSVKRKVHKNITHDWSQDCALIQRQHTTAVKYTFYGLLSVLQ